MQTKNSQVNQTTTQPALFVAAEVENPLADRKLVMKWVPTGLDYPKMEARWIYDRAH